MEFNFLKGCCHYCSVALFTSFLLFLAEVVSTYNCQKKLLIKFNFILHYECGNCTANKLIN